MLADKPQDFENLHSPANGARDWLDQSNIIDMCRSSVNIGRRRGSLFTVRWKSCSAVPMLWDFEASTLLPKKVQHCFRYFPYRMFEASPA